MLIQAPNSSRSFFMRKINPCGVRRKTAESERALSWGLLKPQGPYNKLHFSYWINRQFLLIIIFLNIACAVFAETTASYYTVKSCLKEGTSGIMANGKELKDDQLTCASWDYSFGTRLRITNLGNKKSVVAVVTDRGPAKRLYRQGRVIDLSKGAFAQIASLKQGIIPIKIEVIK